MDPRDALIRVAQRVDHSRAEGVHNWIIDRLSDYGTTGIATDNPDVIRHSGESWGRGLGLLGEVIMAIHDQDAPRVAAILARPSQWLAMALWVLLDQTQGKPPQWLNAWQETDDPGVMMRRVNDVIALLSTVALADRLFREGSVSHAMLSGVFRGEPEASEKASLWALTHLALLTGSILRIKEHGAPTDDWSKELLATANLCADLSPEILGDGET